MTKIISFEGIDGTGKGTQAELLSESLQNKGFKVLNIEFPMYHSFFGKQIGAFLSGSEGVTADSVDGKSMALWFALDRFEALKQYCISDYDFVLINRYVLSNAVYQSVRDCDIGKPDLLDFVYTLEFNHFCIPKPDLILLFDMDLKSASQNVDKKGFRSYIGNGRDVYESIPDLQLRAREKYLEFSKKLNNVRVVGCMENGILRSKEDIASDVMSIICESFRV